MRMRARGTLIAGSLVAAALLGGCSADPAEAPSGSAPSAVDEQAAKAAVLKEIERENADFLDIDDPPTVEPVRWVRPEEAQEALDSCLATQGFAPDAEGTTMVPLERKKAYNLAMYVCTLRYPPIPKYAQPYGPEQKQIQYEWTVGYLLPCLAANGYVLKEPVPSKSAFVDTWDSSPFRPFGEFDEAGSEFTLSNRTRNRLEKDCAQNAPSTVLWDGQSVADYQAAHPFRTGN